MAQVMNKLIIGAAIVGALIASNKTRVIESATVRGIRNNNAGNIRANKIIWDGQTGIDSAGFAIFKSPEWGIRALAKLLLNYEKIHGLSTVSGIIDRYAPAVENNTSAYINSVAGSLGVDPYTSFPVREKLTPLINAIIKHENGINPYSAVIIANGITLVEGYSYA